RKGLDVFCKAIELMPHGSLRGKKVVLLGRNGTVQGKDARHYLKRATAKWKCDFERINDLGQEEALDYLRTHDAIAVIPSQSETFGYTTLECIASGIPMIASNIPAFREQIASQRQNGIFFEPNPESLKRKLLGILRKGVPRPALTVSERRNRRLWAEWHARSTYPTARTVKKAQATPL